MFNQANFEGKTQSHKFKAMWEVSFSVDWKATSCQSNAKASSIWNLTTSKK